MKSVWMASAVFALAVPASAQQFSAPSKSDSPQSATMSTDSSPRDQALDRAALAMIHKEFEDAATIYKSLLRDTPNDAVLWNRLGIAYQQQDMFKEALKSYQHAAKADTKSGDAWNNMGTIYFQQRRWDKAVRSYKKAIKLSPSSATFYSNMGIAYLNNKHVPEAFAAFQKALELDPEVFEHRGRVGTIIQSHSATDSGAFYFLLAKSYAESKNAERCAFYLRKARDEGYTGIERAKTDPDFVPMLNDATIRNILGLPELPGAPPKPTGIG